MTVTKLIEALDELHRQRKTIDDAIEHLNRAVDVLRGNAPRVEPLAIAAEERMIMSDTIGYRVGSHLDNVIQVLRTAAKPMHITEITKEVGKVTGKEATRASVDGAVSRHLRDSKCPRLKRVEPGVYALLSDGDSKDRKGQEVLFGGPAPKTKTRAEMVAEFIGSHGPSTRKELHDGTQMPLGSLATCLNDKTRFTRLPDGRWDLATPHADVENGELSHA